MKKIISLLLLTMFIVIGTSCTKNEKQIEQKVEQRNAESLKIEAGEVGTTNTFKERKIETKFEDNKLSIGSAVVISEGQSEYIDFDFPVIKGGTIYKNSNVKKYGFIILEEEIEIEKIIKYYKLELKKLGWTQEENSDNLIFTKNKTNNLLDELKININSNIPQVLKDNYDFEGNYIDFYLGTRVIHEEIEELIIPE